MEMDQALKTQWIGNLGWYSVCTSNIGKVHLMDPGESIQEQLTETRNFLLISSFYVEKRLESIAKDVVDKRFLQLMCSASFYLCGFEQKAHSILNQLDQVPYAPLEFLLYWMIQYPKIPAYKEDLTNTLGSKIQDVISSIASSESFTIAVSSLRKKLDESRSPRWMIVGDVICAVEHAMIVRNKISST